MWATLKVDGAYEVHEGIPTLDQLQAAVSGDVEVVAIKRGIDMWINEEGKYQTPARNLLAGVLTMGLLFPGDYIAGDVVFTGGADEEGETLGLSDEQVEYLNQLRPPAGHATRVIEAIGLVDVTGIQV